MSVESFQALQRQFTAHIRDPDKVAAPEGLEDRRMGIYRELFFNNVQGFISNAFPLLKSHYSDEQWTQVARAFFKTHRCHSPYFAHIAREFLDYLREEHQASDNDPPWILDLAHYEWVELALSIEEDSPPPDDLIADGDPMQGIPVLSSLAWLLQYDWPVHRLRANPQPEAETVFLMAYRNAQDAVKVMELNPLTALLVERIEDNQQANGQELLESIASDVQQLDRDLVLQGGQQAYAQLRAADMLIGTR